MFWLTLAILTRLFWSFCNVIDQYIVRYFPGGGSLCSVILQNMLILPTLLALLLIFGLPPAPDRITFLWIAFGVLCSFPAAFPYFMAIQKDDARNAVPLFEMTPVILIILAGLVFHEVMTLRQVAGALLIIACGFAFVWDFNQNRLRLRTFLLMALSSFLYAIYQLSVRFVSHQLPAYAVTMYFLTGLFLGGVVLAIVMKTPRRKVIDAIRQSRGKIVGIALISQIFWCLSFFCQAGAMAGAPTAGHVAAFSGTQPIFVFGLSLLLSWKIEHHYPRLKWDRDTKMKLLILAVMLGGIALLQLK